MRDCTGMHTTDAAVLLWQVLDRDAMPNLFALVSAHSSASSGLRSRLPLCLLAVLFSWRVVPGTLPIKKPPHNCACVVLQVFGEGVVNDAVSVVLLGAVAAAAHAHGSDSSKHRLAGGIVANFIWLLVTSLGLGGAAGLGIAVALKKLKLQGAHQVRCTVCR